MRSTSALWTPRMLFHFALNFQRASFFIACIGSVAQWRSVLPCLLFHAVIYNRDKQFDTNKWNKTTCEKNMTREKKKKLIASVHHFFSHHSAYILFIIKRKKIREFWNANSIRWHIYLFDGVENLTTFPSNGTCTAICWLAMAWYFWHRSSSTSAINSLKQVPIGESEHRLRFTNSSTNANDEWIQRYQNTRVFCQTPSIKWCAENPLLEMARDVHFGAAHYGKKLSTLSSICKWKVFPREQTRQQLFARAFTCTHFSRGIRIVNGVDSEKFQWNSLFRWIFHVSFITCTRRIICFMGSETNLKFRMDRVLELMTIETRLLWAIHQHIDQVSELCSEMGKTRAITCEKLLAVRWTISSHSLKFQRYLPFSQEYNESAP